MERTVEISIREKLLFTGLTLLFTMSINKSNENENDIFNNDSTILENSNIKYDIIDGSSSSSCFHKNEGNISLLIINSQSLRCIGECK